VPLNYATAYSVFALRCLIGPDIPNNAGSLAPFTVTAPKGCILNAQAPAPVAMRHTIGQMTRSGVWLPVAGPAGPVPAEGASCMYDLPLRNAPEVDRGTPGLRPGAGLQRRHRRAAGTSDGLSATAFPSGVWGSQVETTEAVAPVLIHRRELRPDSGGPGTQRGGLGQRIEMGAATDQDVLVFLSVERVTTPAAGRHGGQPGAPGRIRIGEDGMDLPPKGTFRIPAGETLVFETPGGGGFGPPEARSDTDLSRDIATGLVTAPSSYRGTT
jgi:N-methylhydantoinase B